MALTGLAWLRGSSERGVATALRSVMRHGLPGIIQTAAACGPPRRCK